MTLDWDGWRRQDWDGQRLLELFHEFGFRGFAERVRKTLTTSGAKKNAEVLATAGVASDGGRDGQPATAAPITQAPPRANPEAGRSPASSTRSMASTDGRRAAANQPPTAGGTMATNWSIRPRPSSASSAS